MELTPGLWQQQSMKLTMTNELKQAIELLQYSNEELLEYLENKALENPLLQIESNNVKTMDPQIDFVKKKRNKTHQERQDWLESIARKNVPILSEYLLSQLDIHSFAFEQKRILFFLIHSLDENGYLPIKIEEAATILKVQETEVNTALRKIQELDPAGVGARNLQECLVLQVKRKEEPNELAISILSDYFLLFAEKKWNEIAKGLNIELKQIQDILDYVQQLNPKPAKDYHSENAMYIRPDLMIKYENGELFLQLYEDVLPKIQMNETYFQRFHDSPEEKVKQFIQEKYQDFQWLMRSIEQRKETLVKVTHCIMKKQKDYFIHGPDHLIPMTMKEIAEELGIHESTVSRAVREKYVQTPFGTAELKSFFSNTIKTTSNEDASSKQVKKHLLDLVTKEDKFKPFSDQELVRLLKENNGIIISRRTVAKYREQLGIVSSNKRKRFG